MCIPPYSNHIYIRSCTIFVHGSDQFIFLELFPQEHIRFSPSSEALPAQADCSPLPHWQISLTRFVECGSRAVVAVQADSPAPGREAHPLCESHRETHATACNFVCQPVLCKAHAGEKKGLTDLHEGVTQSSGSTSKLIYCNT